MKSLQSPAHLILITRLKSARKSAGLTQEDLAIRIGRPQSYVSAYEKGYRNVYIEILIRICDVLEINIHIIIEEMRQASKPKKNLKKVARR